MFKSLETPKLQRLHDVLNRALGLVYDTANHEGLEPPDWVPEASKDVRAMYSEIWLRRGIEDSDLKGGDQVATGKD